ncbi:MAG: hypothetical protein N2489_07845 [Clostridia bacterium]|nr:hypothetical protein [Clostridia bacterium]
MKKLVLILVSAVIMTVFIAFNYLLWDRENKIRSFEYINDSKNDSINTLRKQLDDYEKGNNVLKERIIELEEINKRLQAKNTELDREKSKTEKLLERRNDTIAGLLPKTDLKPMEDVIRKWVNSIDNEKYDDAYSLQFRHASTMEEPMSYSDFTQNYIKGIKSITLKSIKLNTEDLPSDKKGSIIFKVGLDVKRTEEAGSKEFVEGTNERYFLITFDKQKKEWVIGGIYKYL